MQSDFALTVSLAASLTGRFASIFGMFRLMNFETGSLSI